MNIFRVKYSFKTTFGYNFLYECSIDPNLLDTFFIFSIFLSNTLIGAHVSKPVCIPGHLLEESLAWDWCQESPHVVLYDKMSGLV